MSWWGRSTEATAPPGGGLELDLGVKGVAGQQVGAAGAAGFGDRGVEVVLGLGARLGGGGGQGRGHDVGDLVELGGTHAQGGEGRGTQADAGGGPGAVWVRRERV